MWVGILIRGEGWQQNHKYQRPETVTATESVTCLERVEKINGMYDIT